MNCLFFSLLLATVTLAASNDGSPTVSTDVPLDLPKDLLSGLFTDSLGHIYSNLHLITKTRLKATSREYKDFFDTLDAQATPIQRELESLNRFRGHNQVPRLDEMFVSMRVRDHGVQETQIRHAVELARKYQREYLYPRGPELKELLEPILQPMKAADLDALILHIGQEERMMADGGEGELFTVYNDDRRMDLLFAVMFNEGDGSPLSPIQFEFKVRTALIAVRNALEPFDLDDPMLELLGPETNDAFKVWKILQLARQTIKQKRSELKGLYEPNSNVDTQMIELLVPLLRPIADRGKIQKIMEQARFANTLELAVVFKKQHVLRNFVTSSIECPVFIFQGIVQQAYQVEIVEILLQHRSFQADVFFKLMRRTIYACNEDQLAIATMLLKYRLATSEYSSFIVDLVYELVKGCELYQEAFSAARKSFVTKNLIE